MGIPIDQLLVSEAVSDILLFFFYLFPDCWDLFSELLLPDLK